MASYSSLSHPSVNAINAALALLGRVTADDLLAVHKARRLLLGKVVLKAASIAARTTKGVALLSHEEKLHHKNEVQRAFRATPEGRAYANAASKRSNEAKRKAAGCL